MQKQALVRVNKYSRKIKELSILKRVSVDYPLLCQDEVARKLATIANKLPEDMFLQIDSAYRTRKTQKILWQVRKDAVPGLVHNPSDGESPHCTGGAIDISFIGSLNREINLSEPFPKFYNEPQFVSEKITPKAQKLRNLMNKIMCEEGFAPNPREYWHFSYGDKMWAEHTKSVPLYSETDLAKDMYYPILQRLFYKVLRKMWKAFNKVFSVQTNY